MHARQAEASGYRAIGSVLRAEAHRLPELFDCTGGTPVLQACRLVGHALGLEVRTAVDGDEELAYEDHVTAIANASGFRTRLVALRDDWWRRDQGPLLAQLAEGRNPVAVLPTSPTSNQMSIRRPTPNGKRRPSVAASLSGSPILLSAVTEGALLKPADLIRFGGVGLKPDFRTVALMAITLGAIGMVTRT